MIENSGSSKKKLLYVSENGGTPDTAMFIHTINLAKLFEKIGYEVSIVSEGSQEFIDEEEYKGIKHYSTKFKLRNGLPGRLLFLFEKLTGKNLIFQIKKQTKNNFPDVILLYGLSPGRWLHRYCAKYKITYLAEMTDWFEASDRNHLYTKLFFQPLYDRHAKILPKAADGIIVISEWLENYYSSANCIRIPPLFDISEFKKYRKYKQRSNNIVSVRCLKVVYVGMVRNKDIIEPFVEALLRVNKEKILIEFEIAGMLQEEFAEKFGERNWTEMGIIVHGRVKHEEALNIVSDADFSILLRYNKRYAKAGFSTKAAESMLCGVPVIATQVGGTDTVIEDGINGILIPDNESITIERKLKELLKFSDEDLMKIKQNTSKFADSFFSYETYSDMLVRFIERAEKQKKII